METNGPYRPRVSRETRMLLTAGMLALAALWLLARIRFPERPVSANPVPAVLSQLASGPKYDDLAREIADLHARLQPSLLVLEATPALPRARARRPLTAAIRLRDDLAVTLVPAGSGDARWADASTLAVDAASGLAVVRVSLPGPTSPPMSWTRPQLPHSRFLAASDVAPEGVSLRPVFVGSLAAVESPSWSAPVWAVPRHTDLAAGSFLFTSSAEFAGLVVGHDGGLAIVPGGTVLDAAERLLATPPGPAGTVGIEVQDLTPDVASVTGARTGVVVTWVPADGAAKAPLMAGDVIEAVDDRALASREHWEARVARLAVGDTLRLRVRRRDGVGEVAVVATAPGPPASPSLGLTLRARAALGAEVVAVERGSAADRAGLAPADVITRIADVPAPSPAQITRAYTSIGEGARVIVAVTRGRAHFVTTLAR